MRLVDLLEQIMNAFASSAVEIACRLICQEHSRLGDERSRQCDSRLLPARQLARPVRCAIIESHPFKHPLRALARSCVRATTDEQRHHNIFKSCELGQQMMKLENEANFTVPKPSQVYITEFENVKFAKFDAACTWAV